MSHKSKKCLKVQAKERFEKITCLRRSKHADKLTAAREYDRLTEKTMTKQQYINEAIRDKIYSIRTYETYAKHNNYFLEYCEREHGCRTLEQCRKFADEWLQKRIDQGLSPYTIATEKAALCKLYGEPADNFIETPERKREDITRSRERVSRDRGFSLEKNSEIIRFCRGTGLRRDELENLTKSALIDNRDGTYSLGIIGKGGKYREAPIVGENMREIVDRIKNTPDGCKVWEKVPSHMDVHSYRSDYATAIYRSHARDIEDIPLDRVNVGTGKKYRSEAYHCRGDRKGTILDKKAMLKASEALGHNRIDVVASHYIR